MYKITEEGKNYLKNNFPEVNLLKKIKKCSEIKKLKNEVNNFDIAIQWAKKNGWIYIKDGNIFIKNKPKEYVLEKNLKKIVENKKIDENYLEILIQRKLVQKIKEDIEKRAKKFIGKEITNIDTSLIKTGLWRKVKLKKYNVKAMGKNIYPGKIQPYQKFILKIRKKLIELGFKEMTGPIIELEFWNFDALFQPQNHPARDWTDTYTLKYPKYGKLPDKKIVEAVKESHEKSWKYSWDENKAKKLMPRAHDTAISPRYMSKNIEIPGKYFSLVKCYRPDVIDTNHLIEFNQLGGFIIGKEMNLKKLLGLLRTLAFEFSNPEEIKFFPDYYPFTEPSVQINIRDKKMGWIELAGAGIFRKELTKPLGIKEPVIAWGVGVDRLAMSFLEINDIRKLFTYDLKWLRNSKVI